MFHVASVLSLYDDDLADFERFKLQILSPQDAQTN